MMRLKKPIFWDSKKISFWSILLFPITLIYQFLFHQLRFFKNKKNFTVPIICIGNIYLGGTGKTPLAKKIFNIMKSMNKNPTFVKKYYKYLDDEIKMLSKTGKTIACGSRKEGILQSIDFGYDVVILDDGFQDFSIKSNFSVLCFNSKQLIGNGLLIPSGPLRESMRAINRADCIVINGDKNLDFENKIRSYTKKKIDIFYSKYKIRNLEKFKNKKIMAFAGIGNPSNFFDLLKDNGLNIIQSLSFPDHHIYSEKDFKKITINESLKPITTEKDYYRMNEFQKEMCEYIKVDLEIQNEEYFKSLIKKNL